MGFMFMGVITSDSTTPFGTVSIIRPNKLTQVFWKPPPCSPSAIMVALLLLSYRRRSLRDETLKEVTSGPPACPVPFKYSWTTRGSKFATVESRCIPPARLVGDTASGPTTVGKPP